VQEWTGRETGPFFFNRSDSEGAQMDKVQGGKVQGEGDYESAKKFDDAEASFAKSGRVDQAARDAEPKSQAEADEMTKAENAGRSRSKGEDASSRKPKSAGK
jgi:hypothetical protein